MSKTKKLRKLKSDQSNLLIATKTENEQTIEKTVKKPPVKKLKLKKVFATVKKTFSFGKPFNIYLILALTCVTVQTFFELMVPVYLGKSIDLLIGVGAVDFTHLIGTTGWMLVFVVCNAIISFLGDYWTNIYSYKTEGLIREKVFNKFNSVPLGYIDRNQHGDLLSRMVNDIDVLTDGFLNGLATVINGLTSIIGTLIFMLVLNVPLALVVFLLTPVSVVFTIYIAKRSQKLFVEHMKSKGEASGFLEEMISGGRVVKAFAYEKQSLKDFDKINERYYKVSEKEEFYGNLSNPVTRYINSMVYAGVALVGSLLAIGGGVSIGLISAFLTYANTFGQPFAEISGQVTDLQAAFAAADRIFEVLETKEEISDEELPELASVDGFVSVKDAYFSYVPKVKLIENFNLDVSPGQKIAIVGPTGCGKTTFINLLMRFYDLTSGSISIDNNDITKIKRHSLRNKFGMVLQESWLFKASVRDNIAYGKPNATLDEVIEAAKMSGAHEFIDKMPEKYDTIITEGGSNISSGQKQLICISRIMLVKPPMLILDEATSNIDTRTELKIQEVFNTLMKGRTTFIVAHRLSTITSSDIILVMNKGNVIEQGSHSELMEKHGFYYYLYNSQFANTEEQV